MTAPEFDLPQYESEGRTDLINQTVVDILDHLLNTVKTNPNLREGDLERIVAGLADAVVYHRENEE